MPRNAGFGLDMMQNVVYNILEFLIFGKYCPKKTKKEIGGGQACKRKPVQKLE